MKNLLPIFLLLQGSCLFGKIIITDSGTLGGRSLHEALATHTAETLEIEILSDIIVSQPLPPIVDKTFVTIKGTPDGNGKQPNIYSPEGVFHIHGAKNLTISHLNFYTEASFVSITANNVANAYFSHLDVVGSCARLANIHFFSVEDSHFASLSNSDRAPSFQGYAIHTTLFERNIANLQAPLLYLYALKDPHFLPFLERGSWLPSYPTSAPALFFIDNASQDLLASVGTGSFIPPGGWDPNQIPKKKFIKTSLLDHQEGASPAVQSPFIYASGNTKFSKDNPPKPLDPMGPFFLVRRDYSPESGFPSVNINFFGATNNIQDYLSIDDPAMKPYLIEKEAEVAQPVIKAPLPDGFMLIPELFPTPLPFALILPKDDAQAKIDNVLSKPESKEGVFLFFFPGEYTLHKGIVSENIFMRGLGSSLPKIHIQRENTDVFNSPSFFQSNFLYIGDIDLEDFDAESFRNPLITAFSLVLQHSFVKTNQAVFAQYPSTNIATLSAPPTRNGWATLSVCRVQCVDGNSHPQTVFKDYPKALAFTSVVNMKPRESRYPSVFHSVESGQATTSLAETGVFASTLLKVTGTGTAPQDSVHAALDLQRGSNVVAATKAVLEIAGNWENDTKSSFLAISGKGNNDLFTPDSGVLVDGTNIPDHITQNVKTFRENLAKNRINPLP